MSSCVKSSSPRPRPAATAMLAVLLAAGTLAHAGGATDRRVAPARGLQAVPQAEPAAPAEWSWGPDRVGGWASDRLLVKLTPGARLQRTADGSWSVLGPDGHRHMDAERALVAAGARQATSAGTVVPADRERAHALGLDRWIEVSLPAGSDAPRIAAEWMQLESAPWQAAEPVGIGGIAADAPLPNDPLFGEQYALRNTGQVIGGVAGESGADIRALAAWHLSVGSPDTIVAVLDSGVDAHASFADRMVPGWNVPAGNSNTGNLCLDHGTHVAGTIGAAGNDAQGVAGVAWRARIMPVTVLQGCSGTTAWLADGILWATDRGASVLNASLQYSVESQFLRDAIAYAMADGAVVVAAAGNTGTTGLAVPARWPETVAVASIDWLDVPSGSSAVGAGLDVAAPGVGILSTAGLTGHSTKSGTSMAAPFVSGTIALMHAVAPSIAPRDLVPFLLQSCHDIHAAGFDDRTGHGRIDAGAAVRLVRSLRGTADLSGDGTVDGIDLGVVLSGWGACGVACAADLNDDGVVNGIDLGLVLGNWGLVGGD
jgi:subtilisin family serine protease